MRPSCPVTHNPASVTAADVATAQIANRLQGTARNSACHSHLTPVADNTPSPRAGANRFSRCQSTSTADTVNGRWSFGLVLPGVRSRARLDRPQKLTRVKIQEWQSFGTHGFEGAEFYNSLS